jgi:hypothetical protein
MHVLRSHMCGLDFRMEPPFNYTDDDSGNVWNRVCLSHGVQVAGAAWRAATMIVAGVRDIVQRTENDRTGWVLSDRAIERSGGAVCGLHCARGDEKRMFLG